MSAEDRIRAALAARAAQITPERLQPSAPPTTVRRPARSRLPILGAVAGLAAAVLLFLVLTHLPVRTTDELPAAPPSAQPTVSTPAPKPTNPPGRTDGPQPASARPGSPEPGSPEPGSQRLPGPPGPIGTDGMPRQPTKPAQRSP